MEETDKKIKKFFFSLLIVIPIFLIVSSQIFLKIGSKFVKIENFNFLDFLNIFIILSLLCLFLRSVVWLSLFRKFDLTFIYPLTSISYIIMLIISVTFFNDTYTIGKVLGVLLIPIGLLLIGSAKKEKKN